MQIRAGKGVKAGTFNDKTGLLVGLRQIACDEDVILISDKGTLIRIHGYELSEFGRDALGVKVMKMANNEKIVSMAITPIDEDKDVEQQEEEAQNNQPEILEESVNKESLETPKEETFNEENFEQDATNEDADDDEI